LLKLIVSWLNDHRAYVIFGENKSDIFYTYVGLPQGSSLSPYLFIVYHCDLVACVGAHSSHIFADDLNILISPPICREIKPMVKFLEEEGTKMCNLIANYSKKWKQSVNVSKKVAQIFHSQVQNPIINVFMDGKKLEVAKEFKYLGFAWTNKLSLKPTIDKTFENIQRTFNFEIIYIVKLNHFIICQLMQEMHQHQVLVKDLENIDKVLERDKNLSLLDDRADKLQSHAAQFEQQAGKLKNKFWLQNMKEVKATIVMIVFLYYFIVVELHLCSYVYTNYKAVAPAFPSIDVGGTTTPSVKDELPKVSAAPITTPIEEKVTTKRPRRRRKKTTITPNPAGSTVVSTNKSDESNNGQDTSKTVLKRIIRSLIQ
ncbi:unnamed protein product, partial [Rotaria socialis]